MPFGATTSTTYEDKTKYIITLVLNKYTRTVDGVGVLRVSVVTIPALNVW